MKTLVKAKMASLKDKLLADKPKEKVEKLEAKKKKKK